MMEPEHQKITIATLNELSSHVRILVERVDNLIGLHRDIIKWLLIVVCVIALGRSAFDVGKTLVTDLTKTEITSPR